MAGTLQGSSLECDQGGQSREQWQRNCSVAKGRGGGLSETFGNASLSIGRDGKGPFAATSGGIFGLLYLRELFFLPFLIRVLLLLHRVAFQSYGSLSTLFLKSYCNTPHPPRQRNMSAILSADDLNDFISPGVACIKPIETLPVQQTENLVCLYSALRHLAHTNND